jgi:hypothetical protein
MTDTDAFYGIISIQVRTNCIVIRISDQAIPQGRNSAFVPTIVYHLPANPTAINAIAHTLALFIQSIQTTQAGT